MSSIKAKVLFIVNPISGNGQSSNLLEPIVERKSGGRFEYKIETSQFQGHAAEIAKSYLSSSFKIIVAVGGDGTVNEVGSVLVGSDKTLAIIPKGSGNGLANHIGWSNDVETFIDCIINEKYRIQKVDTGTINEIPFMNVSGMGFDGFIASRFNNSRKRGFRTYLDLSVRSFFKYKSPHYRISINSENISEKYFIVAMANGSEYGNNFKISPESQISDGYMELCLVPPIRVSKIPELVYSLLFRRTRLNRFVSHRKFKECTISVEKDVNLHIDGESHPEQWNEFHVAVKEGSLNVIMPV